MIDFADANWVKAILVVLSFIAVCSFLFGIFRGYVEDKDKKQQEIDSRTINLFSKGQSDTVNVISKTGKLLFCFWDGTTFQFVSEKTKNAFTHAVKFCCPVGGESEVFLISQNDSRTLGVIKGLSEKKENLPDPDEIFFL